MTGREDHEMYYAVNLYRLTFMSSLRGCVSICRCANSPRQAIRQLRKSIDVSLDYGTLSNIECSRVRGLEEAQ